MNISCEDSKSMQNQNECLNVSAESYPCKVCQTTAGKVFTRDESDGFIWEARFMDPDYKRNYYQCPKCGLLFHDGFDIMEKMAHQTPDETGQGDRLDFTINRGIREFTMVHLLMELYGLPKASRMLVFGCGPAISYNLLLQHGANVYATDQDLGFVNVREGIPPELFKMELMPEMIRRFRPLKDLQEESYDIITLTEVFEHFLDPVKEMQRLATLLRPGGIVVGTTGWVDRVPEPLKEWWYLKCRTHATFLSSEAFRRICAAAGCMGTLYPNSPSVIGKSSMSKNQCVFVMQKCERRARQ